MYFVKDQQPYGNQQTTIANQNQAAQFHMWKQQQQQIQQKQHFMNQNQQQQHQQLPVPSSSNLQYLLQPNLMQPNQYMNYNNNNQMTHLPSTDETSNDSKTKSVVAPPAQSPSLNNSLTHNNYIMSSTTADNSNMSFTQDNDDDNKSTTSDEPSCSSPKLTRTPSTKSAAAIAAHNAEILNKLIEMGTTSPDNNDLNNQKRKDFVNKLKKIWEDYSIQCRNLPNISKQPLDLFKLYLMVKEKNGFNEVN